MKIAIYGQKTQADLSDFIQPFLKTLEKNKVEYYFNIDFLEHINKTYKLDLERDKTYTNYEDLPRDLELFFTIGGDGTILSAGTIVQDLNIPIVGINSGRLGFLATINHKDLMSELEDILQKKFKLSQRSMVSVEIENTHIPFNFALNEIAVTRQETTSMITVETYLNGEFLNTFWTDGLIISTPTGSTGYSLSCGGPIIYPETTNFVITPIAPHNLNVRPFIIPDNSIIDLKVDSRVPEYFLSLDSRLHSISIEKPLRIKRNNFYMNIVEPKSNSYLKTLCKKLLWGLDSRN